MLAYLARSLRNAQKIILGGERILRYHLYTCGKIFCMPRSFPGVAYLISNEKLIFQGTPMVNTETPPYAAEGGSAVYLF
jgi:hypothetical protein